MAGFQTLQGPRPDPFAFANTQGATMILKAITAAKKQRQVKDQQDALLDIYASDSSAEEKRIQVAGLFAQPKEERGFFDFLNPTTASQGVSSLQDQFTTAGMSDILNPFKRELEQATLAGRRASTKLTKAQVKEVGKTEVQKLTDQGLSKSDAELAFRMSKGLEPRKSSAANYDNKSDAEKLNWLSTLIDKAQGPYFGVEGGTEEPLQPEIYEWGVSEKELVMARLTGKTTKKGDTTPSRAALGIETRKFDENDPDIAAALAEGYTPEEIMEFLKNGQTTTKPVF